MYGKEFDLSKDDEILKIKSPKDSCEGSYLVVDKSIEERWAIVVPLWKKEPRLGFRWFWDNNGYPNSRGHATWMIITPKLQNIILNGLEKYIDCDLKIKIDHFFEGKINGNQLKENNTK